ncbi:hypothetical protein KDN24_06750 [Bacillus sp. Bva_UNVM-123]|uniref:hypothetical protein n=1 Tax=Bacillus sp. Bva_UNVM-123 TaxID=2829798 RepID=UPI00391F7D8A
MVKVELGNKYTVIEDLPNGVFKALRHGEEWRNLVGDNLILSMLYKIEELQEEVDAWREGRIVVEGLE